MILSAQSVNMVLLILKKWWNKYKLHHKLAYIDFKNDFSNTLYIKRHYFRGLLYINFTR